MLKPKSAAGIANHPAVFAIESAVAGGEDLGRGRERSYRRPKAVDASAFHVDASKQRSRDACLAVLQQLMGLRGRNDIAGEKNDPRRLNARQQSAEAGRHFRRFETNDEKLAEVVIHGWVNYSTCFLSSAKRFNASSGVRRLRSSSRRRSSTGCESGVKMVNCAGRRGCVAPCQLCGYPPLGILVLGQHFARPLDDFVGQSRKFCYFDSVTAVGRPGLDFAKKHHRRRPLL